jgi:hypothetical protein
MYVCSKLAKFVGVIGRIKKFVNTDCKLKLFNGLIYPHLLYCIEVWGNTKKGNLQKIHGLQKRLLKLVGNVPNSFPSEVLFKRFNILEIYKLYKFRILCKMFLVWARKAPNSLLTLFTNFADVHRYSTRLVDSGFQIPTYSSNLKGNSIIILGPKLWNFLPRDIKSIDHYPNFKLKIKKFILGQEILT